MWPVDWDNLKSPETYVGHDKTEKFASPGGAAVNTRHLGPAVGGGGEFLEAGVEAFAFTFG